jgi:uncharacterized protein YndB with AHSA1/START domain
MDKPKFVYVSYIQTTPEKLWNALQDPELTKQYWFNHHNDSDWKVGSRWEHKLLTEPPVVHVVGKVVENDPPRRLVVTWANPADEGNEAKTSRVTYELEPCGESVKLTITHDELDTEMFKSISSGWPLVISGLKSILETGKTISTNPNETRRNVNNPA